MDPRRRVYRIEWPTLGLIVACYGGWVLLTLYAQGLGLWLAVPLLAVTLALHSSLQHEALHGHPFPRQALSSALVTPGLGLAIPYGRFRDLHLAHHRDSNLTDPYDDPESNFYDPADYDRMSRPKRVLLRFNNTLFGRLLVGPAIGLEAFLRTERLRIARAEPGVLRAWLIHLATLVPILAWLFTAATIPFWAYLVAGYAALSLLKIRTFLEHQAHVLASGRSVIIEDRGPLALLFLNNNLHSVHHAHPAVAWYDLPRLFRARREEYLRRNRGYYYRSYLEVARRYFFTPKDPVPHPLFERPE